MKQTTGLTFLLLALVLVMFAGKASAAVGLDFNTDACVVAADEDGKKDDDKKKDDEAEPDCD